MKRVRGRRHGIYHVRGKLTFTAFQKADFAAILTEYAVELAAIAVLIDHDRQTWAVGLAIHNGLFDAKNSQNP